MKLLQLTLLLSSLAVSMNSLAGEGQGGNGGPKGKGTHLTGGTNGAGGNRSLIAGACGNASEEVFGHGSNG